MGVRASPAALRCGAAVSVLLRDSILPLRDRQRCLGAGFRFAVIHRAYFRVPDDARTRAEACLGPAVYADQTIWLLDLQGGEPREDCRSSALGNATEPRPPAEGPTVSGVEAIDTPRPGK